MNEILEKTHGVTKKQVYSWQGIWGLRDDSDSKEKKRTFCHEGNVMLHDAYNNTISWNTCTQIN